MIRQAVILAGGRGERLRPLTDDRPKPMVLVNGKPFLEYLVKLLKKNGIQEIVLLLGYLPEKIIEYFGDGEKFGLKIKYSVTPVEDETGTRIRKAKDLIQDKFLLLYSDNYWPLDLEEIFNFYNSKNVMASVTVYNNKDGITKSNMFVGEDGFVKLYDKSRTNPNVNGVEIGFYILDKKVFDLMPEENFVFEKEILPQLISMNQLVGYQTDVRYCTLTNVERLKTAEEYLANIK